MILCSRAFVRLAYMTSPSTIQSTHTAIIADIDRVLECVRDYPRAFSALQILEQDMMLYFDCQRSIFYEKLRRLFQGNRRSLKMIEFLEQDLLDLRVGFLEFTDRYPPEANPVRIRNFPIEFKAFSRKIIDRISLEEEYLFPLLARSNK